MTTSRSHPTARQREYLVFIKAFTDRWGVPPSFEEISRHFQTTPPSVNSMVKTLVARGFLSRVPGAARTLRVVVPVEELRDSGPAVRDSGPAVSTESTTTGAASDVAAAVRLASVVIERMVPALRGADPEHVHRAVRAVVEALEVTLRAAGASDEQRAATQETILRVASIARGDSTEARPGRKLAWWRRSPRT